MSQQPSDPISEADIIEVAKNALKSELMVTAIYQKLVTKFNDKVFSQKLEEFAHAEQIHVNFWKTFLTRRSQNPDDANISSFQINLLAYIYGLLGIGLTLKILEAGERKLIQEYSKIFRSELLTPLERKGISRFLLVELAHEEELNEYETYFEFFIGKIGTIFTQTCGGLVLVLSTAIGLSGVYNDPVMIGVIGLITGLTGAMNTVVGFFFFGRTSQRINEDILERIKNTSRCAPEVYLERVKKYMCKRNYSEECAELIAEEARNKKLVEKIIAEEEYGIRGALPNPMQNALWAGMFKAIGTVLPLSPYFFGFSVSVAIPMSIIITLGLLSVAGSLVAIAAEVSVKDKIVELVSGGLVLSSLTYVFGKSASFLFKYLNIG